MQNGFFPTTEAFQLGPLKEQREAGDNKENTEQSKRT